MKIRIGTSGWSYAEWKGSFYPADLPSSKMLAYYAERLGSVEVNNTFYRMPKPEVLAGWAGQAPDDFTFVLKAPRSITHSAKLGANAQSALAHLFETSAAMEHKLGPILFQTPPWLKKDLSVLEAFLGWIPKERKAAFEFRNTSWFEQDVYDALSRHDAALVAADTGEKGDPPLIPTASWGYARLRREVYEGDSLAEWAKRLTEPQWSDLYVFFKHEDEGTGPKLAARFKELVDARRPDSRS